MSSWQHAGLFDADFQVHTIVQIFFIIQCIWTGSMGVLCTYNPDFASCNGVLSETGVFKRISWKPPPMWYQPPASTVQPNDGSSEEFVNPNVRAAWNVRGGSMTLVVAGALYFGTRETYIVAMMAILWREAYDTVEMFRYKKDYHKILLRIWWTPIGPMPPLLSFNLCNALAMWAIAVAD
mmetsp:Transcript_55534/g.152756  ORF Transcript_55534/g.152756 Transcript_55534/m.152756 type:complete len:180 (-) Transcript_55534:392-931(-)